MRVEIGNYIPLPPSKGELCARDGMDGDVNFSSVREEI